MANVFVHPGCDMVISCADYDALLAQIAALTAQVADLEAQLAAALGG